MKLKIAILAAASLSLFSMAAHANKVEFSANHPMTITYRIAHKNLNNQTILGESETVKFDKQITIPVSLDQYDRAGVIVDSVNGHVLPVSVSEFDKPERCSMTTDKTRTNGKLKFTLLPHTINCKAEGGVYY